MSLEVEGKVKVIMDKQTFKSGFEKREFVITTQEQYPQDIKFECIKDKIALLDPLKPGDEVKVSFNLRGNEYQGRYYVNLQAWRIEQNAGQPAPADQPPSTDTMPPFEEPDMGDGEEDDLPF